MEGIGIKSGEKKMVQAAANCELVISVTAKHSSAVVVYRQNHFIRLKRTISLVAGNERYSQRIKDFAE
jgi:hypothetical protein